MRKLIGYEVIKEQNNFWILFLISNFPESLDQETDQTISEILSEKYKVDMQWIDDFTGYYEGVIDESDGYVDNPTTLKMVLTTGENLFIEFHPGDTIYFIDDKEIGCTGPEYFIRKLNWQEYVLYTNLLEDKQKLLLIPMLAIKKAEQGLLKQIIYAGLKEIEVIKEDDYEMICKEIIENCTVV